MTEGNDRDQLEHRVESSLKVVIGIVCFFFLLAIVTILIAPRFVDSSWMSPTSRYQVQMYEMLDPELYISNSVAGDYNLQHVQHVKKGENLFGYIEGDRLKLIADQELEKYITKKGDKTTKLTHRLLLLRTPTNQESVKKKSETLADEIASKSVEKTQPVTFDIFELYDPQVETAFIYSPIEGCLENWIDENYILLDEPKTAWQKEKGVLYVRNPYEYRVKEIHTPTGQGFVYDQAGRRIRDLAELKSSSLGFISRKELIEQGEQIYAQEGCWYCHTDQTRTLVQDVVLNGSDSYPAPPSSANEYIYQSITFPGTRRIGPDISRVGVKKPSRDWHKSHFWAPKTVSPGSIMPSFHHFFDEDPRGTPGNVVGVPNRQFEAIYQYLMTKGTRITPPTEAWWLGKDPLHIKELIEGNKKN